MKYHFESREYYYYHLYSKKSTEILDFLPKLHQSKMYFAINPKSAFKLANDKYASYLRFKEFYKRDACAYNPAEGLADVYKGFCKFVNNNAKFIVKPLGANCGLGIKIVSAKDYPNTKAIYEELIKTYTEGFIAEQLVVQVNEMAQFHPQSVNTIRINSFRVGNEVELKYPCMRIGRGDSVVDNAGAGGVFGGIDVNTGKLLAVGDEFGRHFKKHPDTGILKRKLVIPRISRKDSLSYHL